MEPIKINIEVGLKESTLTALKEIFGGAQATPAPALAPKKPRQQEVVEAEPKPTPAPQPAPAPAPVDDDDDLPEADAPAAPVPTPTEADARQAVKSARDRGVSAKIIKEYMQSQFGIASSVECPADRRAELIAGLANLAA